MGGLSVVGSPIARVRGLLGREKWVTRVPWCHGEGAEGYVASTPRPHELGRRHAQPIARTPSIGGVIVDEAVAGEADDHYVVVCQDRPVHMVGEKWVVGLDHYWMPSGKLVPKIVRCPPAELARRGVWSRHLQAVLAEHQGQVLDPRASFGVGYPQQPVGFIPQGLGGDVETEALHHHGNGCRAAVGSGPG